ncbi:MAG: PP2C family protein-serine/threonine phosphatase [Mycobacteriales bacterium]
MTYASDVTSSAPVRVASAVLGAPSRLLGRVRRDPPPERVAVLGLMLLSVLLVGAGVQLGQSWMPPGVQIVPLLLGGLLVGRRCYLRLCVVVAVALVTTFLVDQGSASPPGAVLVVAFAGAVGFEFARSRDETGLGGTRGDSVLVELKRRLDLQGELPALPQGWKAEVVVKPAGGGPFAGDFVVSALTAHRFEVALVDVSGKGVEAGTRALLLSGALGGLLGADEPVDYLGAANAYLIRQDWEEGFATAVHLSVDLASGSYAIGSAGHPPVAHFDAGSGLWGLDTAHGPALGLLPDADYDRTTGVLRPGDALLLYTDGLVEVPGRDLSVGIDKLLGEAERLVPRGFEGGGEALVQRVAAGSSDDRGLVLIWRDRS